MTELTSIQLLIVVAYSMSQYHFTLIHPVVKQAMNIYISPCIACLTMPHQSIGTNGRIKRVLQCPSLTLPIKAHVQITQQTINCTLNQLNFYQTERGAIQYSKSRVSG
jgi:hypothetical protein